MTEGSGSDDEWDDAWEQGASDDVEPDSAKHDEALTPSKKWKEIDRPRSFDDLVGQDGVRAALRDRITVGHNQDHLIFHGPSGVGKRAIGALYGQAIVCSSSTASEKPCGSCMGCVDYVSAGWNGHWYDLEVMFMKARSDAIAELGRAPVTAKDHHAVDKRARLALSTDMSSIASRLTKVSMQNLYSVGNAVVLIDNADLMSSDIADKFLNALENIDTPTTCIFATTDLDKLRPALRSRCQAYRVAPLDRDRAMQRLVRACERLSILPDFEVLQLIAGCASYRAGAMLNRLWEVYHAGSVTLQQARNALSLDWVEQAYHALSAMTKGDKKQVQIVFRCLSEEPREALNRLRVTMQAIEAIERVRSPDRDAVLPSAFMYANESLISSLRALLSEAAAQIAMSPSEYRVWLMSQLNNVNASRPASILAEVTLLSRAMRGGQRGAETDSGASSSVGTCS